MKKLLQNKLAFLSLAALLVVGMVGGAFAYFNQSLTANNEFKTKPYSTEITEKFDKPQNMTPGAKVTKEVAVKNTGEVEVMVRVSYEEKWQKNKPDVNGNPVVLPSQFDNDSNAGTPNVDTMEKKWSAAVFAPVTEAALSDGTKVAAGQWIKADGWYYFSNPVKPGYCTPLLLESVTMNKALTNSVLNVTTVWDPSIKDTNGNTIGGWKTVKSESGVSGYDDATYSLVFNGQTVQADQAAFTTVFGLSQVPAGVNCPADPQQ